MKVRMYESMMIGYKSKIMILYKRHDPIKVLKWEHEQTIMDLWWILRKAT